MYLRRLTNPNNHNNPTPSRRVGPTTDLPLVMFQGKATHQTLNIQDESIKIVPAASQTIHALQSLMLLLELLAAVSSVISSSQVWVQLEAHWSAGSAVRTMASIESGEKTNGSASKIGGNGGITGVTAVMTGRGVVVETTETGIRHKVRDTVTLVMMAYRTVTRGGRVMTKTDLEREHPGSFHLDALWALLTTFFMTASFLALGAWR